jgi:WhiB family transcriptional regulator, redox-sensing transcriptional regulator
VISTGLSSPVSTKTTDDGWSPLEDPIHMTTQIKFEPQTKFEPQIKSEPQTYLTSVGSSSAAVTPIAIGVTGSAATSPVKWDVDHWRTEAACSSLDTNLFFPDPETQDEVLPQIAAAKGICAGCPVRQSCLEFAIRTRQLDGVWGGHTPEERRSIRRRRQAAARRAAAA